MNIFKYFDFILEKIDDVLPFKFSSDVKDKLDDINSPISNAILNMEGVPSKYTLLSIGDGDDVISFVTADKLVGDGFNNIEQNDERWKKRSIEMKIGRFVKKIFRDKFKDSDIEQFTNKWKSLSSVGKFEIWDGERIKRAYSSKNYTQDGPGSSQLMNSCMNDQLDLIDFYVYSSVKILVLLDKSGYITGRALVWKDYKDRLIMDRVYFTWDSDYHKFIKYAKDSGWYCKNRNVSGWTPLIDSEGKEHHLNTRVNVPNVDSMINDNSFPYMDTFFYATGNHAMNYEPDGSFIKMQSTDGTFEEMTNEQDINGNDIDDMRDYEYSRTQDGYIIRDDSINVEYDSRGYGSPYSFDDWLEVDYLMNSDDFVEMDDNWYKKSHCVWSEKEKRWIFRPDAIYVKNDWVHYDNFNVNN